MAVSGRPKASISPWQYALGVSQSSQQVNPGDVFVAIIGKRVDGHDFIGQARDKGAVCAIVERYVDVKIPQILVASSVEAMGGIAKMYHARLQIPVVAVTGSVGKTSTKEMIAHVLSAKFRVHKGRDNFNNELGVPIESFRIAADDEISVLELAMRGRGQISYLSRMVRPTIGVVTNVGISHIEMLGSKDEIAKAKREIVSGMDSESTLVLNRDDPYFDMFSVSAKGKVISFGESSVADFRISNLQLDRHGFPSFLINGVPIRMEKAMGKQHAFNGAATFAVASELGVQSEEIAKMMVSFETPRSRGNMSHAKSGAIILDNTYNAAPDSIRSSLLTLADLRSKGNRTIAVIGDMLELGSYSEEAHRHLGKLIKEVGLDFLVTIGEGSRFVGEEAKMKGWKHCSDATAAAAFLLTEVQRNDVVMLQGSRVMLLDIVVGALETGTLVTRPD